MVYSKAYSAWDVGHYLCKTPPLFGIWHVYKQICISVHRQFHSAFIFLLRGAVAANSLPWSKSAHHIIKIIPFPSKMSSPVVFFWMGFFNGVRATTKSKPLEALLHSRGSCEFCGQPHFKMGWNTLTWGLSMTKFFEHVCICSLFITCPLLRPLWHTHEGSVFEIDNIQPHCMSYLRRGWSNECV